MLARSRSTPQTWSLNSGKKVFHAPIVFMENLKLKRPEPEHAMSSFYIGVSLVDQTRAALLLQASQDRQSIQKGNTTFLSNQSEFQMLTQVILVQLMLLKLRVC